MRDTMSGDISCLEMYKDKLRGQGDNSGSSGKRQGDRSIDHR